MSAPPRPAPARRVRRRGLPWTLALLLSLPAGTLQADDQAPRAQGNAAEDAGRRLFLEAAARVAAGRADLARVRDLFVDLEDVHTRQRGSRHDGYLRVYYQAPHRLRWEQRGRKREAPLVKILDDNRLWIVTADEAGTRRVRAVHRGPEGAGAVRQVQADRDRFADLARFLSLASLAGPGVRFRAEGTFSGPPPPHLAGTWLKVRRRAPRGRRLAFLFEPVQRADGTTGAGWPAAVLLPRDAGRDAPTEHYVLRDWVRDGRTARPRRIEGWTQEQPGGPFTRTLLAFPVALRINEGLDARLFRPPAEGPPGR